MAKKISPESKAFRDSLKSRLGMQSPETPEEAISGAWTALEQAVVSAQDGLEALAERVGPEEKAVIGDTMDALADSMSEAVTALEAVEDQLVELGLVEDDDIAEPDSPAADA